MLFVGLACGAVSAMSAFENGLTQGTTDLAKLVFGVGFVAIVIATWFAPIVAEEALRERQYLRWSIIMLPWLGAVIFTVTNAIGYASLHRTDSVSGREQGLQQYERAEASLIRLGGDIAVMKASKLFARSAGCGNDTAPESITFCNAYRAKAAEMRQAEQILAKPKPGSIDPQADSIALWFGTDAKATAQRLPGSFAITLEIVAMMAFYAAMGGRKADPAPIPAMELSVDPEPSSGLLETVPEKPAKLTRQKTPLALPAPGILLRKDGQIDGRCAMARRTRKIAVA